MIDATDGLRWRRPATCGDYGDCVELALSPSGKIFMRDSKNPDGNMLSLTRAALRALIECIIAGMFDDLA